MTDDLIDRLATGLTPTPRHVPERRLLLAALAGIVVPILLLFLWLGLRRDYPQAFADPIFWIKFGYTAVLGSVGFVVTTRLARPGSAMPPAIWLAPAALGLVVLLGIGQLVMNAPDETRSLLIGSTALLCPVYIVALGVPFLIAAFTAMRTLAPTRPMLAGLAAGLMSGGMGAWVYAFHCGENGLPFLAIWYTLGIAIVGVLGAIAGRFALRW